MRPVPTTPLPPTLAERVRAVLAEEGRPPSRRAVAAWIRGGAVSVDGRTARDPAVLLHAAARVSVDLEAAMDVARGARGAGRSSRAAQPAPPPWLLHVDAQLVVVDRAGFPTALGPDAFAEAVSRALAAGPGRALALVAVPDPSCAGSGPVLMARSKAIAARLAAGIREGAVHETLLSLRTPALAGPGEVLLERGDTAADGGALPWALVERVEAPLGPPPTGTRALTPPHRGALFLKHPKTNRRLELASAPSPGFARALAGVRAPPGSGSNSRLPRGR